MAEQKSQRRRPGFSSRLRDREEWAVILRRLSNDAPDWSHENHSDGEAEITDEEAQAAHLHWYAELRWSPATSSPPSGASN